MSNPTFDWHPSKFLQSESPEHAPEFALLILNQPIKNNTTLRRLWRTATTRVAADGGANRLHQLSSFQGKFSNLQAIIGDLDSLDTSVRDFYSSQPSAVQIIHDSDQYSTDFQKAIAWVRKTQDGAGIDIIALGGIGGRVDQGLSQLHQLYLSQSSPDYAEGRVYLLSGSSLTFLLKAGSHRIQTREDGEQNVFGKHVGILPLREPSRISTKGLEWDVTDWETQFGGNLSTSNHILPDTRVVEVSTTKDVLFTIALAGRVESDESDEGKAQR